MKLNNVLFNKKMYMGVAFVLVAFAISLTQPHLTSTLGISAYAAKKVIDIISAASSVAAVVGIIAAVVGGGGIGVAVLATAKALVKKYGKAYAAAW
ncbi:circular bacteriocin, circularin A/uberolysin family [Enterococcus faecalis]|jgi:circularin A/uberolysin family circular bacteriocin|uniref:Circular bacteriocin, circularin A/uberolysin family n=1 Tax=Enterococcus faecalis TaxID=1351 RepID=A0ABD7IVR8_ENTFL|nr:uberolysin/carnocyclin family circular bacteriocin [Enterococcus faecalis]EGO2662342.1 circular bacteriocin, circularin A/uberolysin family [Enterococcus faecalis]EGO2744087.1 circular bacteriocin, circularin A/uberolysin family [Enterococcus faecalis]EGO2804163.1 circular bacteriocin, circularin A/uberolysin family [Enterococcus faecalis]EGO2812738.1 circular bacteriocin, circularin A/uberolysin family [Enterococcus faecalis]EGO2823493.1 circular bacteriocin, circularin A/uberolysin family